MFVVISGEKPHTCEICGKPFRVRSDMKRHLKTHGRRRITGTKAQHIQHGFSSNSSDIIITKVEETENSEISDGSNGSRKVDNNTPVSSLQFDQDPLDTAKNGSTL